MATVTAAYPAHLARERTLAGGRKVAIRPVKPGDGIFQTPIDYDRRMAFVCEAGKELVGEARYAAIPGGRGCAFRIIIAEDWSHSGIAPLLMEALIRAAQARGFETMEGRVPREDGEMLRFVERLGFEAQPMEGEPAAVRIVRKL